MLNRRWAFALAGTPISSLLAASPGAGSGEGGGGGVPAGGVAVGVTPHAAAAASAKQRAAAAASIKQRPHRKSQHPYVAAPQAVRQPVVIGRKPGVESH